MNLNPAMNVGTIGNRISRLDLLERVNALNLKAATEERNERYWTVTVLYNTVIWRGGFDYNNEPFAVMFEVYEGIAQ
jgi:hypothetical protein